MLFWWSYRHLNTLRKAHFGDLGTRNGWGLWFVSRAIADSHVLNLWEACKEMVSASAYRNHVQTIPNRPNKNAIDHKIIIESAESPVCTTGNAES